jgi:UDP-N-acetyl-D-mannosaminuronic acid dehydrogenase
MEAAKPENVTVVGLGYIGLPTAALIAKSGFMVTGIDVNASVVDTVNSGGIHIEEADLDAVVQEVVALGRLRASVDTCPSDIFMIAVPTPITDTNAPDVSFVMKATAAIAPHLRPGNLLILESTAPVGTTEKMRDLLGQLRPDLGMPGVGGGNPDINIAYCPERVLPGRILIELVDNDRCIGGITADCSARAQAFYQTFVKGACITTTARTAEMVKLVENSYRDVNIAFANELSLISDSLGVSVWEVINLANRHPRVNILQPGPGVGGHCIAVDPWFLVDSDPANSRLIRTAREVNLHKTEKVIADATALVKSHPNASVACLGLAFKPNIDDFRESPALEVALALAREFGPRIQLVEPFAQSLPDSFDGSGARLSPLSEALGQCEVLILLVDHDVFKSIPPHELSGKTLYDTRGIWPT